MGLLDFIRGKKPPTEAERRAHLLRHGRITEGTIIDVEERDGLDEVAFYCYTINGADFESSDILTPDQRVQRLRYAPGSKVNVRFDPRNQSNSVLE